jgi:hypothetical protein
VLHDHQQQADIKTHMHNHYVEQLRKLSTNMHVKHIAEKRVALLEMKAGRTAAEATATVHTCYQLS